MTGSADRTGEADRGESPPAVRLGDYLSAILQEFTRAEMQARAHAARLARDVSGEPGLGDLPVSLFAVDEAVVTARVAVAAIGSGERHPRDEGPEGEDDGAVRVWVSADRLSEVDPELLTTLEITLTGGSVRWEELDDEGELVRT